MADWDDSADEIDDRIRAIRAAGRRVCWSCDGTGDRWMLDADGDRECWICRPCSGRGWFDDPTAEDDWPGPERAA